MRKKNLKRYFPLEYLPKTNTVSENVNLNNKPFLNKVLSNGKLGKHILSSKQILVCNCWRGLVLGIIMFSLIYKYR